MLLSCIMGNVGASEFVAPKLKVFDLCTAVSALTTLKHIHLRKYLFTPPDTFISLSQALNLKI